MRLVFLLLLLTSIVISSFGCKVANCQICQKDISKCQKCQGGYRLLSSVKCQQCYDKNCLECPSYYGRCQKCKDAFYRTAGHCIPCVDKNCRLCPDSYLECSQCIDQKFKLRQGKCVLNDNDL